MEAIEKALNATVDMQTGHSRDEIQSTFDGLKQLLADLALPKNRALMRFAFAWQKFDQELAALEAKLRERAEETPVNKVNALLQQLVKKT